MKNKFTRIISYILFSFIIMQMLLPLCAFAESDAEIIAAIIGRAQAVTGVTAPGELGVYNYLVFDFSDEKYIDSDSSGKMFLSINGNKYYISVDNNSDPYMGDSFSVYTSMTSSVSGIAVKFDRNDLNDPNTAFNGPKKMNIDINIDRPSGTTIVSGSIGQGSVSVTTSTSENNENPENNENQSSEMHIISASEGSQNYTWDVSGENWWFQVQKTGTYRVEQDDNGVAQIYGGTSDIPIAFGYENENGQQNGEIASPFHRVLYAGQSYKINIKFNSITFEYANIATDTESQTGDTTYQIIEQESLLDKLEHLIADMVTACGNTIVMLVSAALRRPVTIDDIIFNHYDMTNINFFEGEFQEGSIIGSLKDAINNWYNLFRNIAILGYFIILVYMAVKILLGTTAQKKADYKALFINWIVGLFILFLFPYVIKYEIKINEGFVAAVEASKSNIFEGQAFPEPSTQNVGTIDYDEDFSEIDSSGTDYMSIMRNRAQETRRLFNAIAYLIMVWQLIFIIILYYKRVFMIAFLLVLFPLVALSYVLDKVGDGKSQAFNTWSKEMMLNIFVQSFHAIVYIFALGATYSGGNISNPDYILMLVGITFLFKGEEIIKRIFGQSSPAGTVGSLAETAVKTVAAVTITKNVAKNLKDNVVGAKSHLGNFINATRDFKMYRAQERNFDRVAQRRSNYIGMTNIPDNPNDAEKELAEAIGTFRNRDYRNPNQLAGAMSTMMKYAGKGANFDRMLKDANLSNSQIEAMKNMNNKLSSMAKSGASSTDISQTIKAEIDYIFPAGEDKKLLYAVIVADMAHGTHSDRVTNIDDVKGELDRKYERLERVRSDISETDEKVLSDEEKDRRDKKINVRIQQIVNESIGSRTISADTRSNLEKVARGAAVIENSHLYSKRELFEETKNAASISDSTVKKMVTNGTGKDIDIYNHIISDDICKQTYGEDYRKESTADRIVRDTKYSDISEEASKIITSYEDVHSRRNVEKNDEFTLHEVIRNQNTTEEEKNSMAERVRHQRRLQNMDEIIATRDIGKKLIEEENIDIMKANNTEGPATIDGYTKEDIHDLKMAALDEMDEQALRTISTVGLSTATGVIGGIVGAVIHDDKTSGIEGAGMGAIAGAGIRDKIAEKAAGNEKNTKNITMINPETGDVITVNQAQLGGAFSTSGRIAASGIPIQGLKGLWVRYDPNVNRTIIQDRVRRRIKEDEKRNS